MENENRVKLGAGIITISIIEIVFGVIGILSSIVYLFMADSTLDTISSIYAQQGLDFNELMPSNFQMIVSIILSLLLLICIILILAKKTIGVYGYFILEAILIVFSIICNGFSFTIIFSLIIPALYAFFIYKKKEIFFAN